MPTNVEYVSTFLGGLVIAGIIAFVGLIVGTIVQEFWHALRRKSGSSCDIISRLNTATWLLIATEVIWFFSIALRHFCLPVEN